MENAFSKSTGEVLKHFSVTETQGLSEAQINASREKHGRNGTSTCSILSKGK
jgi:Ca2+ transporting ATPase